MQRRNFLTSLAALPLAGLTMKLNELDTLTAPLPPSERMPVLFLGHGSPMNAIEENEFVAGFRAIGKGIPRPRAILCVSAHWETRGTWVTAMDKPPTIHDFGGFPRELYEVQYPAPGDPNLAGETRELVKKTEVGLDNKWGLDHGAWTVVKHIYPKADIPIIQMSLDYFQGPQYHYELGQELRRLRDRGVLIVGSGNMVHNLGMVAWDKLKADNYGYDWAIEASEKMKQFIRNDDHGSLINYSSLGKPFALSIPTPEHYLPLLYSLALKDKDDQVSFFNDKAVGGSLTMTSLRIDKA